MQTIKLWHIAAILICGLVGAGLAVCFTLDRTLVATSLFGVLGFILGMGAGAAAIASPGEMLVGLIRMLGKLAS